MKKDRSSHLQALSINEVTETGFLKQELTFYVASSSFVVVCQFQDLNHIIEGFSSKMTLTNKNIIFDLLSFSIIKIM